jgi:quinolinate synthase
MAQGAPGQDVKILFLPDQHLGRNTAAAYGIDVATQSCIYDPVLTRKGHDLGGAAPEALLASRVILWAGHCSVHKLFRPEHCTSIRAQDAAAGTKTHVIVHPECCKEVVDLADMTGSTEFIIQTIDNAPPGTRWAVGTEVHLVNRLANRARERGVEVRILSECQCLCTTMYRIDPQHLLWALDGIAEGREPNVVRVHPDAKAQARLALERMLRNTAPAGQGAVPSAAAAAPALVD